MSRLLVVLTFLLTALVTAPHCADTDLLTSEERGWLQKHGIIKVGVFKDYPPFGFLDEAGNSKGISIDYWMTLAKRLNLTVQFQPMEFARQLESLRGGQVDSLAGIFPLGERDRYFDFSQPFALINTYIYVRMNNDIPSLEDLKGLKIGVVKGDSGEILAKAVGLSPRRFSSYPETVSALNKGEVDVIVLDELVATFEISNQKLRNKIRRSTAPVDIGKMTLPVRKGNVVLLGILNKGVESISKQEYEAIAGKWLK
jgi:ABC-type amino acid transport substrate-binding protein